MMWNVRWTTELLTFTYAAHDQQSMNSCSQHTHTCYTICIWKVLHLIYDKACTQSNVILLCSDQKRQILWAFTQETTLFSLPCHIFILPRLKRVSMPDICRVGWYLLIWALLLVNMTDMNINKVTVSVKEAKVLIGEIFLPSFEQFSIISSKAQIELTVAGKGCLNEHTKKHNLRPEAFCLRKSDQTFIRWTFASAFFQARLSQ